MSRSRRGARDWRPKQNKTRVVPIYVQERGERASKRESVDERCNEQQGRRGSHESRSFFAHRVLRIEFIFYCVRLSVCIRRHDGLVSLIFFKFLLLLLLLLCVLVVITSFCGVFSSALLYTVRSSGEPAAIFETRTLLFGLPPPSPPAPFPPPPPPPPLSSPPLPSSLGPPLLLLQFHVLPCSTGFGRVLLGFYRVLSGPLDLPAASNGRGAV